MPTKIPNTVSRKPVGSGGPTKLPEPPAPSGGEERPASSKNGGIHWRACTTMVTSLIFGILLAFGHHVFYNSLSDKPVGVPETVIIGVTRQQLNLTLGALFAFLVKVFLVVAIITAYTQIMWKDIKKQATRLTTIDTIFDVISNFWSLLSFSVWWKYPLLFLLALTTWLIPIVSVTTPSALTIAIAPMNPAPSMLFRVPNVDFHSLNFVNLASSKGSFSYTGATYTVDKIVAATAAQGAILPLAPPATNSSWILDFVGPSIKCTDLQDSAVNAIKNNIQAAVETTGCQIAFGFLAWTPTWNTIDMANGSTTAELYTLPFVVSNTTYSLQGGSLGPLPSDAQSSPFPATLYAALFPNMTNEDQTDDGENKASGCKVETPLPNFTAIQCVLYNVSYHASFSLINGQQTISITQEDTPYNSVTPISFISEGTTYETAIYDMNGTLIAYDPALVQSLAYQAVMDSFGNVIVGTISNSMDSDGGLITNDTSVMSTILGDTEELAWLNKYSQVTSEEGLDWNGIDVVGDTPPTMPFRQALESLFQNITIGFMSSKLLQPNYTSPYAPPSTNVTMETYEPVYVYSPFKLWLAYGLAILFASIGVLLGILAMLLNGVTYTNHFSTILMTARHAHVGTAILPEDGGGKDPLPKYLAKATILFSDSYSATKEREVSWLGDGKDSGVSSRLLSE